MKLRDQLKHIDKLTDGFKFDEAGEMLEKLLILHPDSNDVKIRLAFIRNSMRNPSGTLKLLDDILATKPKHKHAIAMYPSVLFEVIEENSDITVYKSRLELLTKLGFRKIGHDLGTVYQYLSEIYEQSKDYKTAISFLEKKIELNKKDDFLKNYIAESQEKIATLRTLIS